MTDKTREAWETELLAHEPTGKPQVWFTRKEVVSIISAATDRAMAEPHHPQKLVSVRLDYLDAVLRHYVAMVTSSADMKGENVVLLGLLTDCAAVLRTIDPDDSDEAEKLAELLGAIDRAQAPSRHQGALL